MKSHFISREGRCLLILFFGLLAGCLGANATVVGWGAAGQANDFGQFNVPNLTGAKAVASGGWHGLAVTSSNTVVAWGLDDYGQIDVPAGLTSGSSNVIAVAGGLAHSLALTTNGTVIGWGVNSSETSSGAYFGQADIPAAATNAIAISAGAYHSLALKADGTVEAWGYDFYGQCDVPEGLSNVVAIACGGYFSLALLTNGTVVAWGDDYYGQITLPADLTNVVAIAGGGLHGLALKAGGMVEGWGARGVTDDTQDFGQETPPADLTNAISIGAGFFHSLAVRKDGTVEQWGDTSLGQTNPPAGLIGAVAVAGGYASSYALVSDAPAVLASPTNTTIAVSNKVVFTAVAVGGTPMRASWWRTDILTNLGFVRITNAPVSATFNSSQVQVQMSFPTNQSGILTTLTLANNYKAVTNAGNYSLFVVFSNSLGNATSSVAVLTVMSPPKITNQPVNVVASTASTVFFSVGASGSGPLSYQWYVNDNPISQANPTNVLELDNITTNDAGSYHVVVSNAIGSATSSNAVLTVDGTPVITLQPTNTSVIVNSNVTLTAAAGGGQPLIYQWYFSSSNNPAAPLSDGTNVNYTLNDAQPANAGKYYLIVSNNFGSVTSSVVALTILTPPTVLSSPTNVITAISNQVTFTAFVQGTLPMQVSWWRSDLASNLVSFSYTGNLHTSTFTGGSAGVNTNTNSAGFTATLTLSAGNKALTNVGNYSFFVVFTNSFGMATSTPASLQVLAAPSIVSQPASVVTNAGSTIYFTVNAAGSGPLSYQWYMNGNPLSVAAPTNVLELDNVTTNDAGEYQVVVSNAVGSILSSNALLTVGGAPAITLQPTNSTVIVNSNVTLTAAAAGADPLTYQWYFFQSSNSITALPDGTNVNYPLASAQTNNAGSYYLIVSNNFGSVTSIVAVLTVLTPPIILTSPTNVVTAISNQVTFTATVAGAIPMGVSWWRSDLPTNLVFINYTNTSKIVTGSFVNGNAVMNVNTNGAGFATTLTLLRNNGILTNAGNYSFYVVFTNSLGVATSSVASLTVLAPPFIVAPPVNVATNAGGTVFFTVGATGSGPLSYQWFFNGAPLGPAAPTNVLELDNVTTNSEGYYQVVVTNAIGSVNARAFLTVLANGSLTPPYLWLLNHDPANGDGIMIALEAGRNYRVLSSTDMLTWNVVTNFLSQSSLVMFTNSTFTNLPVQYYRIVTP